MKKYTLITLVLLALVTLSCKDEASEKPTQMQQVIAIHDEVMPKMGTIGKLIGQLEDKIEVAENPEPYRAARKDLREANKAMMDWMKGFGDSFDGDEIMNGKALTDEKQKVLDQQEISVKALRDQMNNSIATAEKLLE